MASDRMVYHVVPDASGKQWVVTQENGSFREEFSTKADAEAFAKARARGQEPSQVKVHKSDGNMEYESYGLDPARTLS